MQNIIAQKLYHAKMHKLTGCQSIQKNNAYYTIRGSHSAHCACMPN